MEIAYPSPLHPKPAATFSIFFPLFFLLYFFLPVLLAFFPSFLPSVHPPTIYLGLYNNQVSQTSVLQPKGLMQLLELPLTSFSGLAS